MKYADGATSTLNRTRDGKRCETDLREGWVLSEQTDPTSDFLSFGYLAVKIGNQQGVKGIRNRGEIYSLPDFLGGRKNIFPA